MSARYVVPLAMFAVCALTSVQGHAADPDENANWLQLRQLLFGERTIHGHATDVLQLFVSRRRFYD